MELVSAVVGFVGGAAAGLLVPRRRRASACESAGGEVRADVALSALQLDTLDRAALTAAVASILNAAASGQRVRALGELSAYLPAQTGRLDSMHPADLEHLDQGTVIATAALAGRLRFARDMTLARAGGAQPPPTPEDCMPLALMWRGVATAVLGVMDRLTRVCSNDHDLAGSPRWNRVVELLREASQGRAPCLEEDGFVLVPGMAERRAEPRPPIGAPGMLRRRGGEQDVWVKDYSAGGLGLAGASDVVPGDLVTVVFDSGLELTGEAMWSRNGRVGIRLAERLEEQISPD